jgi:6-phosphogluconolactonase
MMQWVRRSAAAVGLFGLTFTLGCPGFFVYPGTASTSGSNGDYVYIANATTDSVAGFSVGTGTLTAVSGSPYSLPFSPTAAVVNPADTILFVAGSSLIYAYSIGTGGALTVLNSGVAVGTAYTVSMVISPDGQWLFALDGNGLTVDEFLINATTGVLSQVTGASYSISGATVVPRAITVSPNGQYVFVALGTGGDLVYPFNTSTGVLSSPLTLAPVSSTTSDNGLAVSPNSAYLFIARSGTGSGVAAYAIGTGGSLTEVSGGAYTAGNQPFSVVVNTAGTDVYVANQLDSTISGFSIGSGGALTAISGSPYTSGSAVTALAVDRTADYLLAAARGGSPDLTMYSYDQTTAGKLDLSTSTATGTDPTGAVALALTH